jgi:hypothetical protein
MYISLYHLFVTWQKLVVTLVHISGIQLPAGQQLSNGLGVIKNICAPIGGREGYQFNTVGEEGVLENNV